MVGALAGLVSLALVGCGSATPEASPGGPSPATSAGSSPAGSLGPTGSPGPAASPAPPAADRPQPRGRAPAASPAPAAAGRTTRPGGPAAGGEYAFPVVADPISYHRTHAGYPATDIFADCGSPVRAVTDGLVIEVSRVDRYNPDHPDGADKGGRFVSVRGDDGVRYYGSHLREVSPGIDAGVRVAAGQRVGSVGRTGNSSNVCHLHFGVSPPCAATGDWWIRRGVVWPWPYLDAWGDGADRSPASEVAAWHRDHGCPPAP